eukprot:1195964-Prorocentrum_minimum.AAC.7
MKTDIGWPDSLTCRLTGSLTYWLTGCRHLCNLYQNRYRPASLPHCLTASLPHWLQALALLDDLTVLEGGKAQGPPPKPLSKRQVLKRTANKLERQLSAAAIAYVAAKNARKSPEVRIHTTSR